MILLFSVNILALFIFIILFYSFLFNYLLLMSKIFFFISLIALSSYFLLIVFIFLLRVNLFGKFTSGVSRFWKQSFYLFWSLEFILFFIYLYLYLNTTSELWVLDLSVLNYNSYINTYNFAINLLCWVIIICVLNLLFTSNVYGSPSIFNLFFLLLVLNIFLTELYSFVYFSSFFFNYIYIYDSTELVWSLESDFFITKPALFYTYIFSFLKLWHTLFILYYTFFFLSFSTSIKLTNLNYYFLVQNVYFLLVFFFFSFLIFLKPYFIYYFIYIYSEFFLLNNILTIFLAKVLSLNYSLYI